MVETRRGGGIDIQPVRRSAPVNMADPAQSSNALIEALTASLTAALARLQPAGEASVTRYTPPTPEPFSGEDRSLLRAFLTDCDEWMRFFPSATAEMKASMLGSRLTGLAKKTYMALIETHPDSALTVEQVKEALRRDFADPNELLKARQRWRRLRQGSSSVLQFAAELREVVSTPGMDIYASNDAVLQHQFRDGLSAAIQDRLLLEEFDSFEQLVAAADKVEQKLRKSSDAAAQASKPHSKQWGTSSPPGNRHTSGSGRPFKPRRFGESRQSQPGLRSSLPAKGDDKYVPPPQRQGDDKPVPGTDGSLDRSKRCHICQRFGHYSPVCPDRKPARSIKQENRNAR